MLLLVLAIAEEKIAVSKVGNCGRRWRGVSSVQHSDHRIQNSHTCTSGCLVFLGKSTASCDQCMACISFQCCTLPYRAVAMYGSTSSCQASVQMLPGFSRGGGLSFPCYGQGCSAVLRDDHRVLHGLGLRLAGSLNTDCDCSLLLSAALF